MNGGFRTASGMLRRGIRSITDPVLLLHGDRDRLVPVGVARAAARANPAWSLAILPGVGHVPQLETPQETAAIITEWLGSEGRPAAEAATTGRRLSPRMPSRPHRWPWTRHKALPRG